ncbi:MAG TPA: hypothetical protein VMV10_14345 [Pirellulales bacterium]|nr:hypothetical protein [Pirellulales bacterium]
MSIQARPDLDILYRILVRTAQNQKTMSYEDLSNEYQRETGAWYHYHGTWDRPLGELNNRLYAAQRFPPLSAVVTYKPQTGEELIPGDGFWGSAPNVPERPRSSDRRQEVWAEILNRVYAADWPDQLPIVDEKHESPSDAWPSAEELAMLKARLSVPQPTYTTAEVLEHLRSLDRQ